MDINLCKPTTTVSVSDRGLHYGDGFFTTARVEQHTLVFLEKHLQRLQMTAERLNFQDFNRSVLEKQLRSKLPQFGVCKVIITRGVGQRGYAVPIHPKTECYVLFSELPSQLLELKRLNEKCLTVSDIPASINTSLAGLKHLNRLDNVLAKSNIANTTYDDAIMLEGPHVIGTTQANIFFRFKDNQVITPKNHKAGVNGIMKHYIIQKLISIGVTIDEKEISLQEAMTAEECFISNALVGIESIKSIQQVSFASSDMAQLLLNDFIQCVLKR